MEKSTLHRKDAYRARHDTEVHSTNIDPPAERLSLLIHLVEAEVMRKLTLEETIPGLLDGLDDGLASLLVVGGLGGEEHLLYGIALLENSASADSAFLVADLAKDQSLNF